MCPSGLELKKMTSVVPANSEGEVTIVTNSRGSSSNSRHSSASASRVSVEVNPASGSSSSQRPQNPPPPPAAPPPPQTYSPEHQDEVVRVVSGRWSQYIDGGKGSPPGSSRGSNGSAAGSGSGSAAGSNESVDRPGADAASPGQFKKSFGKLNVASKRRNPHLNAEPILPPPTLVQMSPGGHEKIIGLDDDDFG